MRVRSLLPPVLAAVLVAVVALALGKSSPHSSAASPSRAQDVTSAKVVHVTIQNFAYRPDTFTVRAGTKLVVTNRDQTAHTLTAKSGAFDTGAIQPNKTMTITVTKTGTFPFYCQFHAFMTGTLKVVG